MGLLICAAIVKKDGNKLIHEDYKLYESDKWVGDDLFLGDVEWEWICESKDPYLDCTQFGRPKDLNGSYISVMNDIRIPEGNRKRFVKLIDDMRRNEDLYIYLNI